MKIDIVVVDLILVALVVIPFFIFIMLGLRESGRLKKRFHKETAKHNLNLCETDHWNSNMIGLDKDKLKLLLVQGTKKSFSVELVDLKPISSVKLVHETKARKINGRPEDVLQRVDLEFLKYTGEASLVLNLYNNESTVYQDHELSHAEKWSKFLNEVLTQRPKVSKAA